ncbi:L,D-transpeptidase [Marinobacter sp. CHS3-4]|uniref:L,D-transpeptidase n=1 Tax=Marinobacter sp. CHS3-4 TaxID=3045174 RepID=UPI0024B5FDB7|nr:L,D-transpeptidase [Marinobacter sp. CHS3-4]MDI9245854.1 L,D-transpeptidase [Marinobacter sp. CHS3-4]
MPNDPARESFPRLEISLDQQTLTLWLENQAEPVTYPISSALNGAGELNGSGCTPRGKHYIRAMIGDGQPLNSVFVGRRPTGEILTPELSEQYPQRDWILTRILWLCGCEPGRNRLGQVDSFRRFIYIHGTPESEPMGIPRSHGCIRMRNHDVIALFEQVRAGTSVTIT